MVEDYAMDGFLFSSAVQVNIGDDEFEVMYYPHWVEFLVHPSVLRDSKSKLSRNMRVRNSNLQNTGPYFVGGTLLELNSSNSLKWEDSTVHWDGETEELLINHWQIQPKTDPIPGRPRRIQFRVETSIADSSLTNLGDPRMKLQHWISKVLKLQHWISKVLKLQHWSRISMLLKLYCNLTIKFPKLKLERWISMLY